MPNSESTEKIVKVIDAMAEAHRELFGVYPENRGNVPPLVVEPPTAKFTVSTPHEFDCSGTTGNIMEWVFDSGDGGYPDIKYDAFQWGRGKPGKLYHTYTHPSANGFPATLRVKDYNGLKSIYTYKVVVK